MYPIQSSKATQGRGLMLMMNEDMMQMIGSVDYEVKEEKRRLPLDLKGLRL